MITANEIKGGAHAPCGPSLDPPLVANVRLVYEELKDKGNSRPNQHEKWRYFSDFGET